MTGARVATILLCSILVGASPLHALGQSAQSQPRTKNVAAVVSTYFHNSHADVIVSRLLETHSLDGKGEVSPLRLVSLYTDQVPANDISRKLAAKHNIPIFARVADALTLNTGKLAVDGVLLVAEHGQYAQSPSGQIQYPKRRLFEQVVEVFENSGRSVPVFIDKHLADTWQDAKWIYDKSRELKFPLMAGSSVPQLWRYPPADVERGAPLREILVISYHTLDAYGFHGLEILQALAERRRGGETGILAVQSYVGEAAWKAADAGFFDKAMLEACLARLKRPPPPGKSLRELVKEPVLFRIEYADGLKAHMLTLNGAIGEWSAAWKYEPSGRIDSTLFYTQEARPFMHFSYLLHGVEQMHLTGTAAWPVERTLLTSGVLDALLQSKLQNGQRLATPQLGFSYQCDWNWRQPPPPPPDRPLDGQE